MEIRIVIFGTERSSTVNTILERKRSGFYSRFLSVIDKCVKESCVRFNQRILIVDTHGFNCGSEITQDQLNKCMRIASPGPHAFIFVISSRYTTEEQTLVEHLVSHFGEKIYKYLIVLFTAGDYLDEEGICLTDHIKFMPPEFKLLIQKCDGRVIAFNNRILGEEQDQQVLDLLSMILENVENNERKCYTYAM